MRDFYAYLFFVLIPMLFWAYMVHYNITKILILSVMLMWTLCYLSEKIA